MGNAIQTFANSEGKITTDIHSAHSDFGNSLSIQPDGKIVVAGYSGLSNMSSYQDFAVARYNRDGSLDTGFDTDGKLTTSIGLLNAAYGMDVATQADGKILVAGYVVEYSNSNFALVRYNVDGSLDTDFDGSGIVTTGFGSANEAGYSVAVQNDGKILVAGKSNSSILTGNDFALVRYNPDGSLDTSFNGKGMVTTDFGGQDVGKSIAIQPDGKILVAGYSNNGGTANDFAIVRYNPDGYIDYSFGSSGKLTTAISSKDDYGYSVALQPDGKILVAGSSGGFPNDVLTLVRYNPDGTLDASFSSDGKATADFGASYEIGYSVVVQSDGKILVAGSAGGAGSYIALARYNPDGILDSSFDLDGKVGTSVGTYSNGYSAAVQGDGKIVVAGYTSTNGNNDFVLVRYNSDGSYDTDITSSAPIDLTSPNILSFSPADEATDIAIGSNIVLTFSETIQRGSGAIVLKDAAGTVVASYDAATSANLAVSGSTLTLDPATDLAYSTAYQVEFAAGSIKDLAGNAYAGTAAYNFATAAAPDTAPPTVLSFSPADEATGIAIGSNIVLTFSEAIQRGSGAIVLKDAAGTVLASYDAATSANLAVSGSTLTLDPSADLAYSTAHRVEFAAGSVKDLAGNAYAGTAAYNFATAAPIPLIGTLGNDILTGGTGVDSLDGGDGIDVATYAGNCANYTIIKTAKGYTVRDNVTSGGTDALMNIERLKFEDITINLTIKATAATIANDDLKLLQELYVAFFKRVPDAGGLEYWINNLKSGYTFDQISDLFYNAGVIYSAQTGYSDTMSNADFIRVIYANVLGRTGDDAPPEADVAWWANRLMAGTETRGTLVNTILSAAHSYKGDATWGWVPDLLDNKIQVANKCAVELGLSYNTPETAIVEGTRIASAVTATDTQAAIALIGLQDIQIVI